MIFVPPRFAAEAILEAADAGVGLVVCITEGIPVKDMARVHSYLAVTGTTLVGPNCPGVISPGEANVGIIPGEICAPGRVGLVSRSGTLVYQIVHELTQRGLGQSTCMGMGGDPVHGVGFIESLALFAEDPGTDLVVMTGEIGGDDEERAAAWISEHMTKPVVGYIAGFTAPAGQADGPRRRDRHRIGGDGCGEGRGPRGRRRPRGADAHRGGRPRGGRPGVTDPAAADRAAGVEGEAGPSWRRSALAGATAFAWVALVAFVIGVLEWLAAGRPFGVRLTWKLGGLYLGAFHDAGVRFTSSIIGGTPTDGVGLFGPEATLHVTFLVGTGFAAMMLWQAGRRAASGSAGGWSHRIAWGASVAPVYALLVWAVAKVVVLRFPSAGLTEVRVVALEAVAGALVLGLAAGGAGGAAAAARALEPPGVLGSRVRAWLVGGWRMTIALLVLAFAGFLVVAGIRSNVSTAYVRGVEAAGTPGAIAAGHHVLLLANQSFLIAAPSMGGCVSIDGSGSQPTTLCLRSFSVRPGFGSTVYPELSSQTVQLPAVWLLFLLVPLGATTWGGHVAATTARGWRERCLRGAGAGAAFAALVVVGEAASAISVQRPPEGDVIRLGADLVRTGAAALAWGIGGGVLGALVPERVQGPVGAVPGEGDGLDAPPRPTSV